MKSVSVSPIKTQKFTGRDLEQPSTSYPVRNNTERDFVVCGVINNGAVYNELLKSGDRHRQQLKNSTERTLNKQNTRESHFQHDNARPRFAKCVKKLFGKRLTRRRTPPTVFAGLGSSALQLISIDAPRDFGTTNLLLGSDNLAE